VWTLEQHMSKHTNEKPFMCHKCSECFKRKEYLKRHEIARHADVRKFICQYCDQRFRRKDSLKCHTLTRHADKVGSDPNHRQFSCRFCGQIFSNYRLLQRHVMREHQSAFCEKCGRKLSSSRVLQNHKCDAVTGHDAAADGVTRVRKAPPRLVGCSTCNTRFTSMIGLERHVAAHDSGNIGSAYNCLLCGEKFELAIALDCRLSEVHSIVRPQHMCNVCGRVYSIESHLKYHMCIHTPDAMMCTLCDKKFITQSSLKMHMITHTEDKPAVEKLFVCSVCGKHFTQAMQLQLH